MNEEKKSEKLHPRHERFAQEYIKDLNKTKAAERTGYSEKTACVQGVRLFTNAKIRERVAELEAEVKNEAIATAQEVEEFLTAAMRGQLTEEKSYISDEKKKERRIAMKERIKAAELLAKRYALLTEKTELSGKDGQPIVIEFSHMRRNEDAE